jgi:formate dehydrogenase maturation protein FdhE
MPIVDIESARHRINQGQFAYDALRIIASCGDLTPGFIQVLEAFEVTGLLSNDERRSLVTHELDVEEIISGWLTGDRIPRDTRKRLARQAAIVVGNAVLRNATQHVGAPSVWKSWSRVVCPCCGGSPDVALMERGGQRTLLCSRCDAQWRTPRLGCLGCDAAESPSIARIANSAVGYELVMCNACGRFLKERPRRGIEAPIVERAITLELDLAAEQRGLRI